MDPSFSLSIDPPLPHPPFPPPSATAAAASATATHNHIAQAANPSPPIAATFNHPPYADMICSAIAALKERDGSSKRAIAKYIERVYTDLPPAHSALLTHHLKRLKNSGLLVMVKKSYKLPTSAAAAESRSDLPNSNNHQQVLSSTSLPGPKRGRGRPSKPKPDGLPITQPVIQPNVQPNSQPMLALLGLAGEPKSEKKGRGRPPRNGPVEQGRPIVPVVGKKGTGRPVGLAKKKSLGRPRKLAPPMVGHSGPKRGRGRPKAQPMMAPFVNVASAPNVQMPRGRPKKVAAAATAVGGGGVVAGKRRGRPPKIGGVSKPMKPKRSNGRPVGRPKKNALWAVTETPEPQAVAAYGELKRKLDLFQSKVKQAVGVLKPQLSSENYSAVAAIQELEGLAAMDISTPMGEEAQPQPHPQLLQN